MKSKDEEIKALKQLIEETQHKIDLLVSTPMEPDKIGTVVTFIRHYGRLKSYTYAAVKTDAGWVMTGALGEHSWEKILKQANGHDIHKIVRVSTVF